ncbi:PAS domain S-box protein [Caulobacter segnis]
MANSAPVLIWATSARGQADWFNQARLNFRGRTLEQELGHGWLEGVHPGRPRSRVPRRPMRRRPGESPSMWLLRLRRADGAWRWINSCRRAALRRGGAYRGYIGSCFDFTETARGAQGPGGPGRRAHRGPGGQHGRDRPRSRRPWPRPPSADSETGRPADRRGGASTSTTR